MKKMKKKILSLLLIVSFIVTVFPITAEAATAACQGTPKALAEQAVYSGYYKKSLSGVKKVMKKRGYDLWNGNFSSDWCAWYLSNCAEHAGIPESVIPRTVWASRGDGSGFEAWAKDEKLFKKSKARGGTYKPKVGDVVFYAWSGGSIQHVEVVYKVTKTNVYTVGGNTGSGKVGRHKFPFRSSYIAGYASPKYNTYTVKYNANGGKGKMSSEEAGIGYKYASKANKFKKKGHKFGGWYVKKNKNLWSVKSGRAWKWSKSKNDRKVYNNKAKLTFYDTSGSARKVSRGNTITLYAKWVPETYKVKYNANGGSGAPASHYKTYGKSLTLQTNIPVREGYEFAGWSTSKKVKIVIYKPGSKYKSNKAVTLYAVWKKK